MPPIDLQGGFVPRSKRIQIGVDITPSPLLVAHGLRGFGNDIRSFREPLKRSIQNVLAPSFQKNFDVGGRPTWEPLSEFTVKMRGSASPILKRSGRLRKVAGQLNIWKIDRDKAFVKGLPSGAWYGNIHQAGLVGARLAMQPQSVVNRALAARSPGTAAGEIPARPFMMIQPEDQEGIEEQFDRWLLERVAANPGMGTPEVGFGRLISL